MKSIKYKKATPIVHEITVPVERVDENGDPVYEEVGVLDEYGQPVFDEDGNPVTESRVIVDYETRTETEYVYNDCEIQCSADVFDSNHAIALRESCDGVVKVEDIPDPVTEPTAEEQLRADLDYVAIMTGVEL